MLLSNYVTERDMEEKTPDTRTYCIRFDPAEAERLAEQARRNERSVSQEIRLLVRQGLEEPVERAA